MSDPKIHTTAPQGEGRARALRARLESVRGAGRRGRLGLPEIVALSCAALLLLAAVSAYLFLLRPARARAQGLAAERAALETRIATARGEFTTRQDTQSSVREILTSLQSFEADHLGVAGDGGTRVYEELHSLMLRNNLRLSGGASYRQLQEAAPEQGAARRQGQRDGGGPRVEQSVFPGVGVTLTVEGTYPDLRRFVRDVEASRHFVVINTVELEGISDASRPNPGGMSAQGAPGPAGRGSRLVSLRLDMAAYFRRAGAAVPR
ncbi:MAG TPA: GspMb/PilO family protein [Pyrinomonadaceae bacterium]|nr:GspMb/PilO family protein [Pyrinomonadaceae bacterium]